MTELVPSVDLKKADGSPLKVNFFFENGLPFKPTNNNDYTFGFHKDNNIPVLLMTIKQDDSVFKNEDIKQVLYETIKNKINLWLVFNSFYICFNDVEDSFKKFYIGISDHNNNYLLKGLINGN